MEKLELHNEAGFSLVELLAVLAVLALVSGLVVVSLPRPEDTPQDAVRELAADLNATIRQSLYDGQTRALAVSEDEWQLRRFSNGTWAVDRAGELRPPVRLAVEDVPVELTEDLQPLVLFEPSGLATPFVLEAGRRAEQFILVGDATGELSVETPNVR